MLDVLGKKHVVEGIEDDEVHRLLCQAGFSTYQGYLFQRPEPLAAALDRLAAKEAVR
jgi:EAL domain-containing protein (putative c-di-GMP-specific phosphodiesterase class I)